MKVYSRILITVCGLVFATVSSYNASAQDLPTKTIYFLAGLKDHAGEEGSGRHETRRDLLVLQNCIDSISNAEGVKIVTKFSY